MLSIIISPLGCSSDGKFFYYFDPILGIVRSLSAYQHRESEFKGIGTEWEWITAIQRLGGVGDRLLDRVNNKTRVKWDGLAQHLMRECRKQGIFDPSVARGRGFWAHSSGDVVFNSGKQLHVLQHDGSVRTMSLTGIEATRNDPHRYVSSTSLAEAFAKHELTAEKGITFIDALSRFSFSRGRHDALLVAGWVACTPLLNFVEFRPQLAITARMGSGKSELVKTLHRAIGPNNCLRLEGSLTSEPGLRQELGRDALPVIIDEFETSQPNAQPLFDLFRSASNPANGRMLKGTPGGTPIEYHVRTMALVAGITMGIKEAADRSRFAVIEMETRSHTEAERQCLTAALSPFDRLFGAELAARMLRRRSEFHMSLQAFRTALRLLGMSDRSSDLYGHLLAGWWTSCHDVPVSESEAAGAVEWLREEQDQTDERACLDFLLAQRLPREWLSIGEALSLLREGRATREAEADLLLLGVRYITADDTILIANRSPGIFKLFAQTSWRNGQHAKELKRMGADDYANKTVAFGPSRSKASALQGSLVFDSD